MKTTTRRVVRALGSIMLAAGVATSIQAQSRHAAPRSGGAGPRPSAPAHHGGSAPRTGSPRGHVAPGGPASGVAHYGHGHGTASGIAHYGYGYGYGGSVPIGYPWWDVGWYGWYGWWDWPGYGYAAYWPWYGAWYGAGYPPYDPTYVGPSEAPQPRGPATVETGVSPAKAEVVLDGESVGFASDYNGRWDKLKLTPGPHTLSFQAKGYRTLVIAFEARPGASYSFHDALVPGEGEDRRNLPEVEPAAPQETRSPVPAPVTTGRLRIRAEPADSAVYLDGEYLGLGADLGRIHGSLAVSTGPHRLEAVRPGYVTAVRTIDVGEAEPVSVELTLERER